MRKCLGVKREQFMLYLWRGEKVSVIPPGSLKRVRRISREAEVLFVVMRMELLSRMEWLQSEREPPITERLNPLSAIQRQHTRPFFSTISTHHEIFLCPIHVSVYQSAHSFLFYKFGQGRFALPRAAQRAENWRDANILNVHLLRRTDIHTHKKLCYLSLSFFLSQT